MEHEGEKPTTVATVLSRHAASHWPKYLAALAAASAIGLGYYAYYRHYNHYI